MSAEISIKQTMIDFIKEHSDDKPEQLLLKYKDKSLSFDIKQAITQISCRQKTKRKLSSLLVNENFLFPSIQAAEQATHQCVAAYHAMIMGKGNKIADLTAGLGIDTLFLSMNGNHVTSFEVDLERYECLLHNSNCFKESIELKQGSLKVIHADSINTLMESNDKYDIIFIDPARRDSTNNRVSRLADCVPDVVRFKNLLLTHSEKLLIKASPLLDIKQILRDFPETEELTIICVKGECKEVLIQCQANMGDSSDDLHNLNPLIHAIDLNDREDGKVEIISDWSCRVNDLRISPEIMPLEQLKPGSYIYDPNAGVHKIKADGKICGDFPGVLKVSPNTELYISEKLYKDFHGRIFKVLDVLDRRKLTGMKESRVSVISRNYPLTAVQIERKFKLKQGDSEYIIAFRAGKEEKCTIVLAKKITNSGII